MFPHVVLDCRWIFFKNERLFYLNLAEAYQPFPLRIQGAWTFSCQYWSLKTVLLSDQNRGQKTDTCAASYLRRTANWADFEFWTFHSHGFLAGLSDAKIPNNPGLLRSLKLLLFLRLWSTLEGVISQTVSCKKGRHSLPRIYIPSKPVASGTFRVFLPSPGTGRDGPITSCYGVVWHIGAGDMKF